MSPQQTARCLFATNKQDFSVSQANIRTEKSYFYCATLLLWRKCHTFTLLIQKFEKVKMSPQTRWHSNASSDLQDFFLFFIFILSAWLQQHPGETKASKLTPQMKTMEANSSSAKTYLHTNASKVWKLKFLLKIHHCKALFDACSSSFPVMEFVSCHMKPIELFHTYVVTADKCFQECVCAHQQSTSLQDLLRLVDPTCVQNWLSSFHIFWLKARSCIFQSDSPSSTHLQTCRPLIWFMHYYTEEQLLSKPCASLCNNYLVAVNEARSLYTCNHCKNTFSALLIFLTRLCCTWNTFSSHLTRISHGRYPQC